MFEGVPMPARSSTRSTEKRFPVVNRFVVLGILALLLVGVLAWKQMQSIAAKRLEAEASAKEEKSIADQKIFLEEVIPLYADAITGTQRVAERSQNTQLQDYAKKSIDVQTKELWLMLGWYQSKYNESLNTLTNTKKALVDVSHLSGDDLDRTYLQEMIDHNTAVLSLARSVSSSVPEGEFQSFITDMITSKTKENEALAKLLEPYLRK